MRGGRWTVKNHTFDGTEQHVEEVDLVCAENASSSPIGEPSRTVTILVKRDEHGPSEADLVYLELTMNQAAGLARSLLELTAGMAE